MVSTLEAIEQILGREEYGAVLTFVDGPATGNKVVLDSGGQVVAGDLPADLSPDAVADAITLMDHEQHRSLAYPPHTV
ncbi:MAG TPA: hypothetical protein VFL72_02995, partial [Acidimicrobiia bacterium]|nr:hypothetical protein [Acidimicrobiia bacterium]